METESKINRLVNFVQGLPTFHIVTEYDGHYSHIGATIADAVLQANMRYETHVRPRIKRIRRIYPQAATMSGLRNLLAEKTTIRFLDWRGMDRVDRFDAIVDLFSAEEVETEDDLREWLMNERNLVKLAKIKGVGPKTIDYFKILTGIQTCAIDRRLLDFLIRAEIEVASYDEAQKIINSAADALGIQRAYFDHSIWEYMGQQGLQLCK